MTENYWFFIQNNKYSDFARDWLCGEWYTTQVSQIWMENRRKSEKSGEIPDAMRQNPEIWRICVKILYWFTKIYTFLKKWEFLFY